jgi:ChrR Cupin-like domain
VLELDAGAIWDGVDLHQSGPEELFVLDGVFNDGIRDDPAGHLRANPAGSSHLPQSRTGCRLFVSSPDGSRTVAEHQAEADPTPPRSPLRCWPPGWLTWPR